MFKGSELPLRAFSRSQGLSFPLIPNTLVEARRAPLQASTSRCSYSAASARSRRSMVVPPIGRLKGTTSGAPTPNVVSLRDAFGTLDPSERGHMSAKCREQEGKWPIHGSKPLTCW